MEDKLFDELLDDNFTPESRGLDSYTFAGFWDRVGASLVDFLILMPIVLLSTYNSLNIKSMALMILLTVLSALYKPYFEWKNSRTPGKKALRIRLIDEDGNNISQKQAIDRYFPWILSYVIAIVLNIQLFMSSGFDKLDSWMELGQVTQEMPLSTVNSLYSIVFIVIILSMLFNDRKQGLHDKFAGTYVVKD